MTDTKEDILHVALRLFARKGYEGTSVSDIAGELGMTKGALYRHYKNKQDIFDSILERMRRMDVERARRHEVPEKTFEESPAAYRATKLGDVRAFLEAQFDFWTADEFGRDFRKMLALERYRSHEMMELYQTCLVSGPVDYTEDLLRELMEREVLNEANPKQLALELYAPFFLLVSASDASVENEEEARLLSAHIERFIERVAIAR
ncbi:TetR family transcriptional regulator [Gordonibacter sp. An230]|uniref:TetR/AcrR family transcriptional regulator n=1 Tax=Gordonibacter sp. An230 TaxID=1965592 RepID=UPI000B3A8D07|nr:TetR/AcrR family transcriptional regulator [Gordonibacter sp. An230]OUO87012.1 TetR family transcriptional regulator [Gordonibacter sp. An230]